MKVSFVALPWIFPHPHFQNHEGYSQNLGIAYIAAFLEKHGHSAVVIDSFVLGDGQRIELFLGTVKMYSYGLTAGQVAEWIPPDTDVIGISCSFNQQAPLIPAIARAIKAKYPDKPVVLGGHYAIAFPKKALIENIDVDIVVRGEGEIPLLDILQGRPLKEIPGILFRQYGGEICDTGSQTCVVTNMDELPFPARHLLPMDSYFTRSSRGL